jgi:cytochrome P450
MEIFYDFSFYSTGEKWKSHRKLLTPAFHFKILENFLPTIMKQTNIMLDLIEKQLKENNGIIEDIRYLITNCTLDAICGKLKKG